MKTRCWFAAPIPKIVQICGVALATSACPGTGAVTADEARVAGLERAAAETVLGTVHDCESRLGALAALSRARPEGVLAQAEQALRIVALQARLRTAGDPRLESACAVPLRRAVWELALRAHKKGQQSRADDGDERAVADVLYRAYLDHFPAAEHATEARFYHAELLWTRERWRDAAAQYAAVAEADPRGRFAREAAYGAVLARKNALGQEHATAGDAGRTPWPLSADEQALMGAFDLYLRVVPDGPERTKVAYRRARTYYEHKLFDQAIPLFATIVDQYAGEELAVYSANLILDSLNILGRQDEVRAWVTRFRNNPALMKDAEFARQMRDIDSDGMDLDGRRAYKEKAYALCARAMKRAADGAPAHPRHAERLFNAVNCFNLAGDAAAAKAAGAELLDSHPDSSLAVRLRARATP